MTSEGFSEAYPHCFRLTQPCFFFYYHIAHSLFPPLYSAGHCHVHLSVTARNGDTPVK